MNNKIVVEVSEADRIFVESICESSHQTFSALFEYMLNEYRKKYGHKKNCRTVNEDYKHFNENQEGFEENLEDSAPESKSLSPSDNKVDNQYENDSAARKKPKK